MPRNESKRQPKPAPKPSRLSKFAEKVKAWHILAAAAVALLGAGWWAKARAGEFATRTEMSAVQLDIQKHNSELAAIHQAITDFASNQDKMMDWVRDIYQHPRK